MTHKERFLATIAREKVDYPASWLGLPVPETLDNLLKHFKLNTLAELKRVLDDDVYEVYVPFNNPPTNDIGCALNFAKVGEGESQYERTLTAPGFFEDIDDIADIETFAWYDPAERIDAQESLARVKAIPDDYFKMGLLWSAHFQDVCAAFGMEEALVVMLSEPELFQAVIDRILKFHLRANEKFYEATKGHLDGVLIGNDFGSQCSLLVSPDALRKFVLPGTKQLIDQAKSYGLKVLHHSCGSIYPVIGDLFDIGVDAIHPIQANATDMGADNLKANFADKGSFFGGVDDQDVLVNYTPEDVEKEILRLKEIFPTGLVFSPSQGTLMPDVSPANIEAMFRAMKL